MKNPAFIKPKSNPFMQHILKHGTEDNPVRVITRNGSIVECMPDSIDESGEQGYRDPAYTYMWDDTGKSLNNPRLDLFELL